MRIGIDAANIRGGGGLTHLTQLLSAADPDLDQFSSVIVWAGGPTLAALPSDQPWLETRSHPLLRRGPLGVALWRRFVLSREARTSCDVLFVPGGLVQPTGLPTITMCQNLLPFDAFERRRNGWGPARWRVALLRPLQARSFLRADGTIFLTHAAREIVTDQLDRKLSRIAVIPHGVETRFARSPKGQESLAQKGDRNPFRLLYVSKVNVYKHQWHVVEAVRRLRDRGFHVQLDLVGGAQPAALRRLRRAFAQHDPDGAFTRYHGNVAFETVHDLYHRCDLFVFASSCETISAILLEAMSAGLPIACADRGPMREILAQGGAYFDPDRPESLVDVLEQLLVDSDRRQQRAEIAKARVQPYTWERCARETFAFIRDAAQASVNRGPRPATV